MRNCHKAFQGPIMLYRASQGLIRFYQCLIRSTRPLEHYRPFKTFSGLLKLYQALPKGLPKTLKRPYKV
jgi:hypothetical protein